MRYFTPAWLNLLLQSKHPKTKAYAVQAKQRLKAAHERDEMLLRLSPAYRRG